MMKKIRKLSVLVLLMVLVCWNCGKSKKDSKPREQPPIQPAPTQVNLAPAEGGKITIALEGEPITLNPVLVTDINSQTLCLLLFDGLVSHDSEMNYVPNLAESWEVSEDKLVITFHLRKNVKWHDGKPFTSEDVAFTYKTIMNPRIHARNKADQFNLVESIETPDPYTFKVIYKKPFAPSFESWETLIIPKHVYKFRRASSFNKPKKKIHPIGTGSYKLKEWIPGESITVERNVDYCLGKPNLEEVAFRFIKSKEEALSLALQGEVDIAPLDPSQWQLFSESPDFAKRFTTLKIFQLTYDYIAWNANGSNPFFKDKRVRRAMTHCLDREQIINRILYGLGKILTGPFIPGSWAYNPNIEPYRFNLEKASQLLAEAGWTKRNKKGVLVKNRKPFEFSIIVRKDQEVRKRIAELLKSNLRKIGVKMYVKKVSFKEWIRLIIETHEYEAAIGGWNINIDPDPYNTWFSGNYKNGLNFVKFSNARADKLMKMGRVTFNKTKRQELYHELHNIIYEEQPYTFLYVRAFIYAINKKIQNIKSSPMGIFDQHPGVAAWYIPKDFQ